MKPVQFLGDPLKSLRDFPSDARQDARRPLDKVQRGKQADEFQTDAVNWQRGRRNTNMG